MLLAWGEACLPGFHASSLGNRCEGAETGQALGRVEDWSWQGNSASRNWPCSGELGKRSPSPKLFAEVSMNQDRHLEVPMHCAVWREGSTVHLPNECPLGFSRMVWTRWLGEIKRTQTSVVARSGKGLLAHRRHWTPRRSFPLIGEGTPLRGGGFESLLPGRYRPGFLVESS